MKRFGALASVLLVAALVIGIAACTSGIGRGQAAVVTGARTVRVMEFGTPVAVIGAAQWAMAHPDIHASYMRNFENNVLYSYVEMFPYISILYEGFGFAFDYNNPRGHVFSMISTDATTRPKAYASCFACKSPNFIALINSGMNVWNVPFDELRSQMVEPVSCFNCHGNQPGTLMVTHLYLVEALGEDFFSHDPRSLSCAQCHVEYYFHPTTREVILPYRTLEGMHPTAILNYFNNLYFDGVLFADFVNPRSGVRQLKLQHPEFETVYGVGSVHNTRMPGPMAFSCSDCHMGTGINALGQSYVNHFWQSPLNNPTLIASSCAQCHGDLATEVRAIQRLAQGRLHDIGMSLAGLMEELVLAVNSGRHSEETLNVIRHTFRNAQFYWDFVMSENSNGAHNSRLTHYSLDRAEELKNDVITLLAQL